MSNEKLKSENYQNFGGINSKYSPYVTQPLEFLNLINFDFYTPGSLSSRWGSTQYVGQTLPGAISALYEYGNLVGQSFVVFGCTGALYYGATTGQSQGISFAGSGTYVSGNNYPFDLSWFGTGFVYGGVATEALPYLGLANYKFFGAPTLTIAGALQSDNNLSFATIDNYMFGADGNKFFKFDGATTTFVGSPPPVCCPIISNTGFTNTPGSTNLVLGATGCYAFAISYVNDRGFEGQIWPVACVNALSAAATLGGSYAVVSVGLYVPSEYRIAYANVYSYWAAATTLSCGYTTTWNLPFTYAYSITFAALSATTGTGFLAGNTFYAAQLGTTVGGITTFPQNLGSLQSALTNAYYPLGFTAGNYLIGVTGVANGYVTSFTTPNYYPRYLEIYKSRLFAAGFSLTPSVIYFSDAGEPEGYQLASNFEVRTDDGDHITAIKAYFTQLYIFKLNSFHVLSGDNPNNFFLQEVSLAYGCLNNRCTTIHEQMLLFLDRKGVMQFNGSSLTVLSLKIQPIFERMNYSAALLTACMVHDKIRNQILIGIPVDGSTVNNLTVVYDYAVNAWTTYNGFAPTIFTAIQGRNNAKNAFYGDAAGRVNWFGPSFLSDNGVGFTAYLKTRYLKDLGDSTQKQFRRLYINMDAESAGTTLNFNYMQDYGSSFVLSRTIAQSVFQTRQDFGISAKSLAFEMSNLNPSSPLRIHGFTIESRLQRRV